MRTPCQFLVYDGYKRCELKWNPCNIWCDGMWGRTSFNGSRQYFLNVPERKVDKFFIKRKRKNESGQSILKAGVLENGVHSHLACFVLLFLLTCYVNIEVVCFLILN